MFTDSPSNVASQIILATTVMGHNEPATLSLRTMIMGINAMHLLSMVINFFILNQCIYVVDMFLL